MPWPSTPDSLTALASGLTAVTAVLLAPVAIGVIPLPVAIVVISLPLTIAPTAAAEVDNRGWRVVAVRVIDHRRRRRKPSKRVDIHADACIGVSRQGRRQSKHDYTKRRNQSFHGRSSQWCNAASTTGLRWRQLTITTWQHSCSHASDGRNLRQPAFSAPLTSRNTVQKRPWPAS